MYFLLISPDGEQALFEALSKEDLFDTSNIGTDIQIIELSHKVVKQIKDSSSPKIPHPHDDDLLF